MSYFFEECKCGVKVANDPWTKTTHIHSQFRVGGTIYDHKVCIHDLVAGIIHADECTCLYRDVLYKIADADSAAYDLPTTTDSITFHDAADKLFRHWVEKGAEEAVARWQSSLEETPEEK